jgi:hypothetical protein
VDEPLDVVTRAYEYQRVRPAVVGTTSGLETVQLTLELVLTDTAHSSQGRGLCAPRYGFFRQ